MRMTNKDWSRAIGMSLLFFLLALCCLGNENATKDDNWLCQHVSPLFCPGIPSLVPTNPPRMKPVPVKRITRLKTRNSDKAR